MRKLSNKSLALIAIALSVVLGGLIAPLAKIALTETTPEFYTLLRFLIATVFLLPIFLRNRIKINKDLFGLMLVSLLATANVILFAYGVRLTTANISQALYVLTPVAVFILSFFLLKERVSLGKVLGIAIGLAGAGFVIILPVIERSAFSGNLTGNIFIITAILSFSLYTVLSQRFQKKYSPIQLTMAFSITTSLAMLILTLPDLPRLIGQIPTYSPMTIIAISYVGFFGTAITYLLYQYTIKYGSATISSTILYLQPLSTIVAAYFLLGERLTPGFIIGGILTIIGTLLVVRSK